jgi:hypothetical protein
MCENTLYSKSKLNRMSKENTIAENNSPASEMGDNTGI